MRIERLASSSIVASILLTSAARADEPAEKYPHYEVYGSVNTFTVQQAIVGLDHICILFCQGPAPARTVTGGPAIGLGFSYYVMPRWSVGAFGNYQGLTLTDSSEPDPFHYNFVTVMGRTDFRWVNASAVQLYSGLALGVVFVDRSSPLPSLQLNVLGLRVGNENIGGFVELGLGMNGILGGGLSVRF